MKISLINPPFKRKGAYFYDFHDTGAYPNPALARLARVCKSNGVEFQVIDSKLESMEDATTIQRILSFDPEIIGITIPTTAEVLDDYDFIRKLKIHLPDSIVVCGGPHISALPERTLRECKEIDIGVIGLGEEIFNDLIRKEFKAKETIGGICYRESGQIITNKNMKRETTKFYPIDWTVFPPAPNYMIFHTTGCPFSCNYCFNVSNHKVNTADEMEVIEELNQIWDYAKPHSFYFADPTFGVNNNDTIKLLKIIIHEGLHNKMTWKCHTRTDKVDKALLELMRDAGCTNVSFGIESGCDRILKMMNKRSSVEIHKKAIEEINQVKGLSYTAFFVFGHIGETREDIEESINFLVQLNPELLAIGVMVPWPGTEVYKAALNGKYNLSLAFNNHPQEWFAYDKYFGSALVNKNVSMRELEILRMLAYLKLYLKNRRFRDLYNFIWSNRGPILKKCGNLISSILNPSKDIQHVRF